MAGLPMDQGFCQGFGAEPESAQCANKDEEKVSMCTSLLLIQQYFPLGLRIHH